MRLDRMMRLLRGRLGASIVGRVSLQRRRDVLIARVGLMGGRNDDENLNSGVLLGDGCGLLYLVISSLQLRWKKYAWGKKIESSKT